MNSRILRTCILTVVMCCVVVSGDFSRAVFSEAQSGTIVSEKQMKVSENSGETGKLKNIADAESDVNGNTKSESDLSGEDLFQDSENIGSELQPEGIAGENSHLSETKPNETRSAEDANGQSESTPGEVTVSQPTAENKQLPTETYDQLVLAESERVKAQLNRVQVLSAFDCSPQVPMASLPHGMESDDSQTEAQQEDKSQGRYPLYPLMTEEEREYIKNAGTVTFAASSGMKPVSFYDTEKQKFDGIATDTLTAICEYCGLDVKFTDRNKDFDLQAAMKNGEIQGVESVVVDEEIAESLNLWVTDAYYYNTINVVANTNVRKYSEKTNKIALCSKYPIFQKIASNAGYDKFLYYDTFEDCVEAVNYGSADITYVPANCMGRLVDHAYYTHLTTFMLPNATYGYGIGVSKYADPMLYQILSKAVANFPEGQRNRILMENMDYTSDPQTFRDTAAQSMPVIMVSIIVIVLMILLAMSMVSRSRKLTNRRLSQAMEMANAANDAKTVFLSRMSHDMRTPMNGILGLVDIMREDDETENLNKNLDQLELSGRYLLNLINDTLDMNKIEAGKLELHATAADLCDILKNLQSNGTMMARDRGIEFMTEFPPKEECEKLNIIADASHLEQVLMNLISNAVKYTHEGGRVALTVKIAEQKTDTVRLDFQVKDNGIGMSEEFLPHLFDPFEQEGRMDGRSQNGTGLGMSIVKNIVDLMDGSISVESKINEGTCISVALTFERYKGKIQNKADFCGEKLNPELLKNLHVLVCEDNVLNQRIMERLLKKAGMTVELASNGQEGLEKFTASEEGFYDVILMDVRMPVMDGLETTRKIRELPRPDAGIIPIIATTANAFDEDVRESIEAGMNAHVAKPIEPQKLYRTILCQTENRTTIKS